jgi:hypothetical protein
MRLKILLISQHYADQKRLGSPELPKPFAPVVPGQEIPSPEAIALADYAIVVGPLPTNDTAIALAGPFRLAIEAGTVGVFAYPSILGSYDQVFLQRLGVGVTSTGLHAAQPYANDPAFYRYFARFGVSEASLGLRDEAERLGTNPSDNGAAAVFRELEQGVLYVVPYHAPGLHDEFLSELFKAIQLHHSGASSGPPAYLDAFRLHGEDDVLDRIRTIEAQLVDVRSEADKLAEYRKLMGPLHDDPLEQLVIKALNVVLEPTKYRAEDRVDLKKEDFWLVDGDGEDFALAEAKGIGTGIRNEHVNKVDNFRGELEKTPEQLPGLLVVNIFRNSDDPDRKQLPVDGQVAATGRRQNVLILRGIDLYRLVSLARQEPKTGSQLVKQIKTGGGGWLEITDSGEQRLHGG